MSRRFSPPKPLVGETGAAVTNLTAEYSSRRTTCGELVTGRQVEPLEMGIVVVMNGLVWRNTNASPPVTSTMTQGHTISTHAEDVHVEVRLDGEVVAIAQRPVLLEETGLPTAYYLPKADLVADVRLLELSTHCPFKGDASYWTIEAGGRTHDAIAWSYEHPKEGAEEIEGHVAFFSDRAEISVDGTPL